MGQGNVFAQGDGERWKVVHILRTPLWLFINYRPYTYRGEHALPHPYSASLREKSAERIPVNNGAPQSS